jgi:hypothetical protein
LGAAVVPPGGMVGALCLESSEERVIIGFIVDRITHRVVRSSFGALVHVVGKLRPDVTVGQGADVLVLPTSCRSASGYCLPFGLWRNRPNYSSLSAQVTP